MRTEQLHAGPATGSKIRQGTGTGAQTPSPDSVELLRAELEEHWRERGDRLDDIVRYALLPSGKLLRPLLFLACARAVGGDPSGLVGAALGVEYLHVGSLVHDDIIDGDDTRRGRPSVVAKYGLPDAIVTGDALILGLFQAVVDGVGPHAPAEAVVEAVRVLARAGVDLCRGQALEALLVGDLACGMDRYLEMAGLKTGALFRGACRSGAVLGGGTSAQARAVARYGEHLGLAFQMQDDVLAYTADAGLTGKSGTCEIVNRRPTFPVLVAHEVAGRRDRARIELALGGTLPAPEAYDLMRDVLASVGALPLARQRARNEAERAKRELPALPPGDSGALLAAVAERAVDREF